VESPSPQAKSLHEPRWHASIAIVAALALYITLPQKLTVGPTWVAPVLVLLILIPLSIFSPRRHAETRRTRLWGIVMIALVNFFNIASIALLIYSFFHPTKDTTPVSASQLLLHGMQIWLTNIIVFALWFWELDSDGPDARAHARNATLFHNADFLFPQVQMTISSGTPVTCIDSEWKPSFFDYLYLAFTNSTAFSPADVMPLSGWAKFLMFVEAMISLITIAIVLARSVSLIQ
jgi:hypothetical protein